MTSFSDILFDAGIRLTDDEEKSHILIQEQSLVIRDLDKALRNTTNTKTFLKTLDTQCKSEDFLKQALMPCQLKKSTNTSAKITQESVIRILLSVTDLQKHIIKIIVNELTTRVVENLDTSWLHLLLNALKYMPLVKEPDSLAVKLLEIFEIAEYPWQLEILNSLPDILPDNQHDVTAKELSKLLAESNELKGAIIDCINSLKLTTGCRSSVLDSVLDQFQSSASLKNFPILFEFVVADCKVANFSTILLKCRQALDTILGSESRDINTHSHKVLALGKVYTLTAIKKQLLEGWLSLLASIKHYQDHKPIDILLLLILHKISSGPKRKQVELLYKRHISAKLLRVDLLEPLFKKYMTAPVIEDYIPDITRLASATLQFTRMDTNFGNDVPLTEFTVVLYNELFSSKSTTVIQKQNLLHSVIVLVGHKPSVCAALTVLSSLRENGLLAGQELQVMGLLELVDRLDLSDIRRVFDVLCGLTCGASAGDDVSGLKDEIHMVVRKRLCSSKMTAKRIGIVAAVVMAKYLGTLKEGCEQDDGDLVDDSITNLGELPIGVAQDAATLLDLTLTSCGDCAELLGLYYDQLAALTVTTPARLDANLLVWLFNVTTCDFQDIYVVDTVPEVAENNGPGLPLSAQFSLNSSEELTVEFSVNIAGLVSAQQSSSEENASAILILPAYFRLLRLLHHKQNDGDLTTIDALIGSGVIMPSLEDIEDLAHDQLKYVCDCLFHCINWFREVISAFITQSNSTFRLKVIQRVVKVLELEELLRDTMKLAMDHKLPVSYFHTTSTQSSVVSLLSKTTTKVTKSRKTAVGNNSSVNESTASISLVSQNVPVKKTSAGRKSSKVEEVVFNFREMDTDLIILLKYHINFPDEEITSQRLAISLNVFEFILKDLVGKMKLVIGNKNLGLSHTSTVKPLDLVLDCQKSLPRINHHFQEILTRLKSLLEKHDGRYDLEEVHTSDATNLKVSFALILEFFYSLFSWSGFQNSKNFNLLRDCLKSVQIDSTSPSRENTNSVYKLLENVITLLSDCADYCMHLPAAVYLLKTMQVLHSVNMKPAVNKTIVTTSCRMLERRWYNLKGDLETGKGSYLNLEVLINGYLAGASVTTICALVAKLQNQVGKLQSREDYLLVFGSIDKGNFHVLYKCICGALEERVRTEMKSLTNSEHLVLWRTTALTMQGLMKILKEHESRFCYRMFLIKTIAILKIFISNGIPILEIQLRTQTEQVVEILKIIQNSTRYLHALCCYSKVRRDTVLMNSVPAFKLVLETLVYKVKAALAANDCSGAFWMGTLKNKNLAGEEILSQSTVTSEENEEGEDEEMEMEDEGMEEGDDTTIGMDSGESEVF